MALEVALLLQRYKIRLTRPQHIAGVANTEADQLSRCWTSTRARMERPMARFAAQSIQKFYRTTCIVDLFATAENRRCDKFCSLHPEKGALATDAFTIPWAALPGAAWINPPFVLMAKVTARLAVDRPPPGSIVIAPAWPAQPWFHQLIAMATEPPVEISPSWLAEPPTNERWQMLAVRL